MFSIKKYLIISFIILIPAIGNTALQGRFELTPGAGDYQVYYDDVADLSWLANSSSVEFQTWQEAQDWVNLVSVNGVNGWRLPTTLQPDLSCSIQETINSVKVSRGYNCSNSELGNMFYNVLGGVKDKTIFQSHNDNYNLFHSPAGPGVAPGNRWAEALNESVASGKAWQFSLSNGFQTHAIKTANAYVWAVHSGDVGLLERPDLESDFDSDGIPDIWEMRGIDVDNDGVIEFDLPALGADPCRKTIAVEIDYMDGSISGFTHKPHPDLISKLTTAFDNAPLPASANCPFQGFPQKPTGVNFVALIDDEIPEQEGVFTTKTELAAVRDSYFDEQLLPWIHYSLYIHTQDIDNSTSGVCCNDGSFIISLGIWRLPDITQPATQVSFFDTNANQDKRLIIEAGTFMHELGHALGLPHGGIDTINFKPNYLSVMNYFFQTRGIYDMDDPDIAKLDYSREVLLPLDETALDETQPLCDHSDCPKLRTAWRTPQGSIFSGLTTIPIDWDDSFSIDSFVQVNLNGNDENLCVGDGSDNVLQTAPEGDDIVAQIDTENTGIYGGPNKTCETTKQATSDDTQFAEPGEKPNVAYEGFDDWSAIKFRAFENLNGSGASVYEVSNSSEIDYQQAKELIDFWDLEVARIQNRPPSVLVPGDFSIESNVAGGWQGDLVAIAGVTTSDPDLDDRVILTSDAPNILPIGTTVVIWTATDKFGVIATATQNIEVLEPPVVVQPIPNPPKNSGGSSNLILLIVLLLNLITRTNSMRKILWKK